MDHFTFQTTGRIVAKKRFGGKISVRLVDDYYDKTAKEEKAIYVDIDVLGKKADHVEEYYHKGDLVTFRGRFQNTQYEKDGETIYTVQHVATEIDLLMRNQSAK